MKKVKIEEELLNLEILNKRIIIKKKMKKRNNNY